MYKASFGVVAPLTTEQKIMRDLGITSDWSKAKAIKTLVEWGHDEAQVKKLYSVWKKKQQAK